MLARRAAILLLIALSACRRTPSIPPDVVARVDDRMLTLADFKRYLERNAGTDLTQITPEVSSAMLDQYLEEVIISEYAASHGVVVPADKIAEAVRTEAGATVIEKRDQMRRERMITDISAEVAAPGGAEIEAYYREHQAEFRSDEEVRVRQILVADEQVAKDLVKRIRGGASFEQLSAEFSRAPNAKRGGEIGFVSRGDLPQTFEQEIFRLKSGQVSDVIRTDSMFHIFKVEERRPPGLLDFSAAAPVIEARLRENTIRDRLAHLVSQSRREMNIAVLTRRLPFQYSGSFRRAEDE